MSTVLPPYITSPAPVYSPEPMQGEKRINYRPRGVAEHLSINRDGLFVKKSNPFTVVLNDQERDSKIPTFGRHSLVNGSLIFDDSSMVSEVSIQLTGNIEFLVVSQGCGSQEIVGERHTLYSATNRDLHSSICPTSLPFSFPFPQTFDLGGKSHPVPPSYEVSLPEGPAGQYIRSRYTLTIKVKKIRHRRTPFLLQNKSLSLDVQYYPRMQPSRPIFGLNSAFLSAFKALPEEWRQFLYSTNSDPSPSSTPFLTFQLYLPSVGVFGLRDTVPLFVQVNGLPGLLRQQLARQISCSSSADRPPLRIYIFRQVEMSLSGARLIRHFVLGEAKLVAVPPPISYFQGDGEDILNWKGTVSCNDDIKVGSFETGSLIVQDSVVVEIRLPDGKTIRRAQRIKLVTNSWSETRPP